MEQYFNRLKIIEEAEKWVGYPSGPYNGPEKGINPEEGPVDCSGFISFVLKRTGVPLPDSIRHANEFFDKYGVLVHIFSPGDLIFFSNKGEAPNHIGLVYDENQYIHAPGKRNSVIEIKSWERRQIANKNNNRIYTENPIGFKRITMQEGRWHKL